MLIALVTRNPSAADARNKVGETPLMYAANMNKMEFVQILVQFNASLEYTDHQEMTLLHVACKNGNKELMQV
jgi:ankyrin repeat protein